MNFLADLINQVRNPSPEQVAQASALLDGAIGLVDVATEIVENAHDVVTDNANKVTNVLTQAQARLKAQHAERVDATVEAEKADWSHFDTIFKNWEGMFKHGAKSDPAHRGTPPKAQESVTEHGKLPETTMEKLVWLLDNSGTSIWSQTEIDLLKTDKPEAVLARQALAAHPFLIDVAFNHHYPNSDKV